MPLIKVDVVKGKKKEELSNILDNVHRAAVEAFEIPERDRYQILTQHDSNEMVLLDTGLGFERSDNKMVIQVISKSRPKEKKELLYSLLVKYLEENCGIQPKDVLISITENTDADWSFGFGRAQFLTGEL